MGPRPAPYNAYEIVYEADGERRRGWYSFHPLSDPDPETLSGKTIRIRCRVGKSRDDGESSLLFLTSSG